VTLDPQSCDGLNQSKLARLAESDKPSVHALHDAGTGVDSFAKVGTMAGMGFVKDRWIDAMQPTPQEWERRWIPVSERLPEDDQQCLTVDKDGVQRVARFDAIGDGERHSWYEEQEWKSVYPVAWMPLPEPPTECP